MVKGIEAVDRIDVVITKVEDCIGVADIKKFVCSEFVASEEVFCMDVVNVEEDVKVDDWFGVDTFEIVDCSGVVANEMAFCVETVKMVDCVDLSTIKTVVLIGVVNKEELIFFDAVTVDKWKGTVVFIIVIVAEEKVILDNIGVCVGTLKSVDSVC